MGRRWSGGNPNKSEIPSSESLTGSPTAVPGRSGRRCKTGWKKPVLTNYHVVRPAIPGFTLNRVEGLAERTGQPTPAVLNQAATTSKQSRVPDRLLHAPRSNIPC